jgi:glutamyl/glutaminyl-tRNA synthetase
MSKRDADAFVDYYRYEKGYLRTALLSFLIRNGSGIRNFDGCQFYTLEDMVKNFDASIIGTRSFQASFFCIQFLFD